MVIKGTVDSITNVNFQEEMNSRTIDPNPEMMLVRAPEIWVVITSSITLASEDNLN
jgi:hypothetical protein